MKRNKFQTYKECIRYLFDLERAGIKYDLRNIKTLLKFSGNPQNNFKSIHIAGTNGKGSVSSVINSFLIEKKLKTGMYTSPHLIDFRERIRVNGKFISTKFIIDFVNRSCEIIEKIKPSFFEVTTAMAFEYFSFMKVKYAVIETGLGGRLDSTNVLKPVLSVITSISIDHTDFLGHRIENISAEKGGIIKRNTPVIIGNVPDVSAKIFKKIAAEKNSRIIFTVDNNKIRITKKTERGFYFDIKDKYCKLFFPVIGDYQVHNINTSLAVIKLFCNIENIELSGIDLRNTFRNIKLNSDLKGRFDLVSSKPKIVIDVSHNLQAIKNIKLNLNYFKYRKLIIIFGMMADKNFKDCIRVLEKINADIVLTKPDYKRAAGPSELYESVKKRRSVFTVKEKLNDAAEYALKIAGKNDMILVTGSFFLASDFLKIFNKIK